MPLCDETALSWGEASKENKIVCVCARARVRVCTGVLVHTYNGQRSICVSQFSFPLFGYLGKGMVVYLVCLFLRYDLFIMQR